MISEAEASGAIPWVASSLRRAGRLEMGVHAVRALEGSTRLRPVKLQQVLAAAPASRKFLSMVMTSLGHADIIHSTRGHHGGYWLDRPLTEISLLDIVDALAPGTSMVPAAAPNGLGAPGALDLVWAQVDAQARSLLQLVTVDRLADGPASPPRGGDRLLEAGRRAPSA